MNFTLSDQDINALKAHSTVKLLSGDGELLSGDLTLLSNWQSDTNSTIWIDLCTQPSNAEKKLLAAFDCHELVIKDAHRERHPPKVEFFEQQTFMLFRGISAISDKLDIEHLQIALFIGKRFLITRHARNAYSIDHWLASDKLAQTLGNPAELALKILGYSAGKYLEQLLSFEEDLSDIEDQMQGHPDDDKLRQLILYRTRLRKLRRVFDYHQKMTNTLQNSKLASQFNELAESRHSIQDFYERCERVHSLSTLFYEICGDLIDGYLSLASHQLNLTMRVLTVITAIFVPLGFIAGLYGMNFSYMPELSHPKGYFITLGAMATIACGLLYLFRKKHWL